MADEKVKGERKEPPKEITPLEEEITARNNPDYKSSQQDNNRGMDILEDEGVIIKKLFN
jgi:hypothetical protein